MKIKFLFFFLFTCPLLEISGQIREHEIVKLKKDLSEAVSGSVRIHFFIELSNGYRFSNIDSALAYVEKPIELSRSVAQPVSLSYDIVKAHGGTLKVNSPPAGRVGKEGVGSEFNIQQPTYHKPTT